MLAAELSIIISILGALLTGGFLMVFIESQKVSSNVTERFNFAMNPFFRSLNSYFKFISTFETSFTFELNKDTDYVEKLKDNVTSIAKYGEQSIMSGQDYPAHYFTAKELDPICYRINNIWYLIDNEHNYIYEHLKFDSNHVEILSEHTKEYLEAIHPKYKGASLTKDLLAKVSGHFFADIYQPIKHILPHYEYWQRKEKEFKILSLITVILTLLTMLLILLLNCYIPICVFKLLCVVCCGLLVYELYKLIKLENLSKTIMR